MARPQGSRNKTAEELKVDAQIAMIKAQKKELDAKKKKLADERNGKKS